MLPSPASSLSFPSPLERREADPYARCDRQQPACNESHEPAQERPEPVATCAFIEEERRRGDPTGLLYALGPRERGEPERVAEWLAALVHHFYLDGPVEPPRTTLGKERCETAPGLCRCCGQPFDFRHKRAALLLLGTHFAARAEAQAASVRRYRR